MKTMNPTPIGSHLRAALKNSALALTLGAAVFFGSGQAANANVDYDFSTGLQGWTQIHPASGDLWAADFGWPVSSSQGHLGAGWNDSDTQMGRSPEFKLDGTGDLTFQTFGSLSPLAAVGVTPSTVPTTAIEGGGFCGLALRDVAADAYVLSKGQSAHNYDSPAVFTTLSFTAAELAPYMNDGKMYTLDWIDYDKGSEHGWGWLVNVSIPTLLTECEITAFGANVAGSSAVIAITNATEGTVVWTVPFGTPLASLAPTLTLSTGAISDPASGEIPDPDFSTAGPWVYTVTAEDLSTTRDYTVTVTEGPPSPACDITSFGTNVAGTAAVITTTSPTTGTVDWYVPSGTVVGFFAPAYTVSALATGDPASETSVDFATPPVAYAVTAQDGTIKTYDVTVRVANALVWNLASGGAWDLGITPNWNLPDNSPTTFANYDEVTFNNTAGGTINIASGMSPLSTTVNAASGEYTFSGGPLAGTGSLTKNNGGQLTISGTSSNNTYSGGTVINGGTLYMYAVDNSKGLGTGPVTLAGGLFWLNRFTCTNDVIVNGGSLYLDNGFGSPMTGPITLNAPNLNITSWYVSHPLSGAISGPGGFTLSSLAGGGLTLSGTNSYEGTTTVNSGTLTFANMDALPGGALSIGLGGAKVALNYSGTKSILSLTLNGVEQMIAGTYGSLTSTATYKSGYFEGPGIVQIGDPAFAANMLSFGTNVAGSSAVIGPVVGNLATITWYLPSGTDLASLAPDFVMTDGAMCLERNTGDLPVPGFDAGPVDYSVISSNGLVTNVYTVTATVLSADTTLIWNLASGGAWNFTNPNWLGQPSGSSTPYFDGVNVIFNNTAGGAIVLDGNLAPLTTTVSAASGTYTFSVAVGGGAITTGSLTKDGGGTLVMAKANSYDGGTLIQSGTLQLNWPGDGVSHTTLGSGPVTLDGGTLRLNRTDLANDLTVNGGSLFLDNGFGSAWTGPITLNAPNLNITSYYNKHPFSGPISGAGGFTLSSFAGGGLTLSGTNDYTGPTTVTSGTLVCKNVNALGSGDVVVSASGTLNLDYVGDHVVASLTLAGTLMPAGTYGSSDPSGRITGSGTVTVVSGYSGWANDNAPGQTPGQDYDNDGVENGLEYFMGQTGSSFTAMPGLDGTNTITWTKDPDYIGAWQVQTSSDLSTWDDVAGTDNGTSVSYTLPPGEGKLFVRLVVTPAP